MTKGQCPTCGKFHGLCKLCGKRYVHCPEDEPGEPFSYCNQCDYEMSGADEEDDLLDNEALEGEA